MFPFVETIKISHQSVHNLKYHQQRYERTCRAVFGITPTHSLEEVLMGRIPENDGLYKCRIEYLREIVKVEIIPYTPPVIRTLLRVHADGLQYSLKSTDRAALNRIRQEAVGYDDALIIRNGLLTDTTFCNIALFDGYHWLTPAQPLLNGTKRQELIERGMLVERDIPVGWIPEFKVMALFNAMNEFGSLLVSVRDIYPETR